ncbi:MAG: hypothetical protein PHC92_02665 [Syntrophomonadaceae bacterium]|nr:hypothetical protein [Syntrophomonadaceae bacterium]MDD3022498.1 hypothetical protein [Syntrophomonadaceae bacterium]
MAIFGAHSIGHGIWVNPFLVIGIIVVAIYVFLKFCSWAKGQQLSGGAKKGIFLLTALGLVVFNVLYSMGNSQISAGGDWSGATTALAGSLLWVFIFAYALMTETKA